MLHKVKASYGDILRGLPELAALLPSSARKKQLLLEMASNSEPRPPKKIELGRALISYTCRTAHAYDPEFNRKIRSLAPHWFVSRAEIASRNKKILISMAKNGDPKPPRDTELGVALRRYIRSESYDAKFDQEIRRLRPDWFTSSAQRNKQILLDMAERRMAKPSPKTKIGKRMKCYMNPNQNTYDPNFTSKIRRLARHWLISRFDTAKQNKRKLLGMAKKGTAKPKQTTKLGQRLVNYTAKNSESHDSDFASKIKRLAPHWFIPQSQSSNENKKKLLLMAGKKRPKPKTNTPIGASLVRYTYKTSESYDPVFEKKIRRVAPHWFISSSQIKKQQILAMAEKRRPRPEYNSTLGCALRNYTLKSSESHDPEFARKIKKLAPHWFKKKAL